MLVDPLPIEMLGAHHASALADLVGRYGDSWARRILRSTTDRRTPWGRSPSNRMTWISQLDQFASALMGLSSPGATAAARTLTAGAWDWLTSRIDHYLQLEPPSRRDEALTELAAPILGFLSAAGTASASQLVGDAVKILCHDDRLLGCLLKVLRERDTLPGREEVAAHCIQRLEHQLAQPERAADDWSITPPTGCDCELCQTLIGFLVAPEERQLEWPIRKDKRQHIHRRIDTAELPVHHQTRRQGSPHTLVLTKSDELFSRERNARKSAEADLAWLRSNTQSC